MSFGDGNLHDEVDRLKVVNGKLCDEINRQERVIERQAERIAELERSTEHYRLKIICYENDVDARDALIRDMFGLLVCACEWDVLDGIHDRMRKLGIEVY